MYHLHLFTHITSLTIRCRRVANLAVSNSFVQGRNRLNLVVLPKMCALQDEISRFREWAPPAENQHGEWECEYEHWDRLWAAAISTIDQYEDAAMPPHVADALLYVLARDNECEHVRDHLVETPQLLSALAAHAIGIEDADAKWQIVVSLRNASRITSRHEVSNLARWCS